MASKRMIIKLATAGALLLSLLIIDATSTVSIKANHTVGFHNAVHMKEIANYGSIAVIEGSNPNLHGGNWTYIRVATVQQTPTFLFGEIG